mgnify:CR=1 FL=1
MAKKDDKEEYKVPHGKDLASLSDAINKLFKGNISTTANNAEEPGSVTRALSISHFCSSRRHFMQVQVIGSATDFPGLVFHPSFFARSEVEPGSNPMR